MMVNASDGNTASTFGVQGDDMAAAHQRRDSAVALSDPPALLPARSSGPRKLEHQDAPLASPARELQSALEAELAAGREAETPRWPGAVRLSIIGGGSLVFWVAIIAAVRAVI